MSVPGFSVWGVTGIPEVAVGNDLVALIGVSHALGKVLGRDLPSRVGRAGPLPEFAE